MTTKIYHGEDTMVHSSMIIEFFTCSVCDKNFPQYEWNDDSKYCPHCGEHFERTTVAKQYTRHTYIDIAQWVEHRPFKSRFLAGGWISE